MAQYLPFRPYCLWGCNSACCCVAALSAAAAATAAATAAAAAAAVAVTVPGVVYRRIPQQFSGKHGVEPKVYMLLWGHDNTVRKGIYACTACTCSNIYLVARKM